MCDGTKAASVPTFLLDAYCAALKVAQRLHTMTSSSANGAYEDNPQDAVQCKNGITTLANGFHHSQSKASSRDAGSVHVNVMENCKNRQQFIPPKAFLDSATSVAVAILLSTDTAAFRGSVRNDVRLILRRLIRSRKVSALTHPAAMIGVDTKTPSFATLLRAMEVSEKEAAETWSAYTPFELASDIFTFCSDVSERQMVAALHYTLSRARPNEIASSIARNKSVGERHPFRKRSARFMALESKRQRSVEEEEQRTRLDHKLIVSGTAYLILRVTEYSKCNAALLRIALECELGREEALFVAQCVIDIVTAPERYQFEPQIGEMRCNIYRRCAMFCGDHLPRMKARQPRTLTERHVGRDIEDGVYTHLAKVAPGFVGSIVRRRSRPTQCKCIRDE